MWSSEKHYLSRGVRNSSRVFHLILQSSIFHIVEFLSSGLGIEAEQCKLLCSLVCMFNFATLPLWMGSKISQQ